MQGDHPSVVADLSRQSHETMPAVPAPTLLGERYLRAIAMAIALITFGVTILILAALFFSGIITGIREGAWLSVMKEHFLAVIGIPMAIVTSFSIVQLLRGFHGPIVIEAKGLKFSGATGPVVLWIFCFLSIVFGMWLLWR